MKGIRRLPLGVALLTSLSFVGMGSTDFVHAQTGSTNVTESQALDHAKAILQVPTEFKLSSESFSNDQNGNAFYNFGFSYTSPDNQNEWINITVDAKSGLITSYDRSSSATGFVYPLPVSAAQAQKLAITWAQKLYPHYVNQVRIQPLAPMSGALNQVVNYQYNFERVVNGIPAPFNGFSITIDQNGTLVSANENWTQAVFPSEKHVMSIVKANQIYKRDLHLYRAYWSNWSANGQAVPYLTYQQVVGNYSAWWNNQYSDPNLRISGIPVIDALSGQPVDAAGKNTALPVYTPVHAIVPGGKQQNLGSVLVNWTEQKALDIAKSVLKIPGKAKLTAANQNTSLPNGDVTWDFSWTVPDGDQYSATVDTTYGILTNFNEWSTKVPVTGVTIASGKKITQSQATSAAIAFVKKALPGDTGGIAVIPSNYSTQQGKVQTNFLIEPLISGIPDISDTGNITVDAKTGDVTSYYTNFQLGKTKFPSPSQAITQAKAKNDWTMGQPLQLVYLQTQPGFDKASGTTPQGKVMLAYAPTGNIIENGTVMDATTGQFVSASGSTPAYTGKINDIGNVAQADQIQLLVQHGLLAVDASGNVHPNQDMTREQFVKLVVDALGRNQPLPMANQLGVYQKAMAMTSSASSGYSEVYSAFVNGWLNDGQVFEPNQPITRGDAAQLLARALGYGELLGHPELFQLNANDASTIPSSQFAGDAIASSLGLLPLQSGAFHPDGNVTIADAAQAVVAMVSDYSSSQGIFNVGVTAGGAAVSQQ